jgi:hypothetical protein
MASTLPNFDDRQNYTGVLSYATFTEDGGTGGGDAVGYFKLATVALLRDEVAADTNKVAFIDDIGGYGAGIFFWDSTSTTADNGTTVIAPSDGGTGRWVRKV